ncbi:hypothetical protein L3X38_014783 [Prunus dulcis]|uniref:Uncharacterized protein n=1 Tax=Prunus dulcis TaxID=3755 RepID=A0AAD4WP07_PRUDU|nr:hypothetical protein L3X38_014783 [Prunus dulcis]
MGLGAGRPLRPLRLKEVHLLKTSSQECPVKNLLYQKQEREAAMLVKKQKTYSLLDADDDDGDRSSAQVVSVSRKADSHKKRFRKKVLS